MEPVQPNHHNNKISRLLTLSAILILISTFSVIIFGYSLKNTNQEIKSLSNFLISAGNLQTDFERSLQVYVKDTKEIIKFLLSLRPANEEGYIEFISKIEQIGKNLSLDLNLQYIATKPKTLDYQISFYGGFKELLAFLRALENLPHYIKVEKLNFKEPELISEEEINKKGNISLLINLYVK